MFCGDETSALVGDLGSRSFKFGFAGEDMPKGWIPSVVRHDGTTLGSSNKKLVGDVELRATGIEAEELTWARKDGKVASWDAVEALWTHAVNIELNSDATTHPIMASCATYESDSDRQTLAELLFEKLNPPALFLARNAMLSAFSMGRATALVVDVGGARTCAAAVHDGFVLNKSIRLSKVAGDYLDEHLIRALESQLEKPLVAAKIPRKSSTLTHWRTLALLQDIKTNSCRVWTEVNFEEEKVDSYEEKSYELPDGTVVELGVKRFRTSELLMRKDADLAYLKERIPVSELENRPVVLPEVLRDSLQSTHVDLRRDLMNQIVLVGGGAMLPGTIERLTKELARVLPSALKPKFLVLGNNERLFSSFTGASILATLGSFQQLWISRQQYDEYGPNIVLERCIH